MTFETALQFVLSEEGGYSDDPRDSGGKTKFGISQAAYPGMDIANLTHDGAAMIYKRDYWLLADCDKLPGAVAFALFDCAVNQGVPSAKRMLQRALKVKVDGVIGPVTIFAAQKADEKALLAEMTAQRALMYARHPQVEIYGLGWFRRLARCQQKALEAI
jgi:lysozyme family protein